MQDIVAEVPAAKDLFSQASEILGYDLLNLCTEGENSEKVEQCSVFCDSQQPHRAASELFFCTGPKNKLNSTVISQPAIYVASLAALEKLRQDEGDVRTFLARSDMPFTA